MFSHNPHMANVTLSVPEELYRKMKKRSEIRWSEVARRAIAEELEKLEGPLGFERSMADIRKMLTDAGVDLDSIPLEKAIKHYRRMRELDWKRAYSTLAN